LKEITPASGSYVHTCVKKAITAIKSKCEPRYRKTVNHCKKSP